MTGSVESPGCRGTGIWEPRDLCRVDGVDGRGLLGRFGTDDAVAVRGVVLDASLGRPKPRSPHAVLKEHPVSWWFLQTLLRRGSCTPSRGACLVAPEFASLTGCRVCAPLPEFANLPERRPVRRPV